MNILGICHDVLICSACVVVDGQIVAAIPEERLDRVKQSRVFPTLAIQECLRIADLEMDDIDEIAVAWNPAKEAETTPAGYLDGRRWRSEHLVQVPSRLLAMSGHQASSAPSMSDLWTGGPRITYIDHYLTHAANGVFNSPFETAAVLVVDGRGETHTGMMARADGHKIEVLAENFFPHSLGLLYGAVTQFLGFKPDGDEWKVMALASYAARGERVPRSDARPRQRERQGDVLPRPCQVRVLQLLGPPDVLRSVRGHIRRAAGAIRSDQRTALPDRGGASAGLRGGHDCAADRAPRDDWPR